MNVSIMQPYFIPYIGYFQLIHASDIFVIYDNIKYTKKGWINRNRLLQNGKDVLISLPLKKDSDYLDVCERKISSDFDKPKFLNYIKALYNRAPYFNQTYSLFEEIIYFNDNNLFNFIYNSLIKILKHLNINTKIIISSTVDIDHNLKSQDKVLAICKSLHAHTYINAIGGIELYDTKTFKEQNIYLKFIKSNPIIYKQFNNNFVSWLSILDILMFNSVENISQMLNQHTLIEGK